MSGVLPGALKKRRVKRRARTFCWHSSLSRSFPNNWDCQESEQEGNSSCLVYQTRYGTVEIVLGLKFGCRILIGNSSKQDIVKQSEEDDGEAYEW